MNCPSCQTVNPEGARFCLNCGAALSISCNKCGSSLPAGARFCFNCGQPVLAGMQVAPGPTPTQPPGAADQASPHAAEFANLVQRYIPKELLNKLETARKAGMLEGERRVVTILFCDVKGSTSAASDLDPEEWAEIINGAFEHMIRPVYAFEGTVARLMGDGLLAFFGAPIAHEDDPQRAVLAGLEIVKAVKAYGEQIQSRWGLDFAVRVGVNTGLVVVGAVGSDLRMEYTALGDAINLAARMEQTAQAGTVQIAEQTHKLIAPLFDFETLDGLEVKGKDTPVRAYRVLGPKATPGKMRGIEGLQAQLIGREEQILALKDAVTGLQSGAGRIVSLIGDAGLGKSRLIAELRQSLAMDGSANVRWLEGHSLSYEAATPFASFIDLLTNFFGLQAVASDQEKYERILAELDPLYPGESAEIAPFFATLLGVQMDDSDAERVKYLEPPNLRAQIFAHVAGLVDRLVAVQPLVMVLDDLHWSDPTSLDLLLSLLPLTDRAPLMVIAAFRPRRQEHAWGFHEAAGRDYHHRYLAIELDPLGEDEARRLVGDLLEIEDLPESVRRLILEKSEGNPFFVEEIIRSLLDGGLVVRQDGHWRATQEIVAISIPDTLTGVITARLDRLDEPDRRALQAASIIGREFSAEVLSDLIEAPDLLTGVLPELMRRDLLRQRTRLPTPIYAFKHVLTQEAAYSSILLSNRRELHNVAAESLLNRSPDDAAEIARHFLEARQPARAMPYLVVAGNKAARAYATTEAIEFFSKALDLRDLAESLEPVRRAYEGLGSALTFANRLPEARKTYEEMLALAETHQDLPMQISALNKLGSLLALNMGQFNEGEGYLARSESMVRQYGEKSSFPELAIIKCQLCTARGDFENVVNYMSEMVKIGEEEENPEHVVMGLEHMANSLAFMTRFDEALEKGLQGLQVVRGLGDRLHESALLTAAIPMSYIRNGDFDAARTALSEGIQIAKRIQALIPQVDGGWMLAELARWQGNYEEALEHGMLSLEAALPLEEYMPFEVVLPLSSLGSIYLEISPRFTDKIAEFHRHALKLLESPIGAMLGGTAWAELGFCAMNLGDLRLAEDSIQKGLNFPTVYSFIEKPRLLAGAALLALTKGELEEANRRIEEARDYAEERGMRQFYPLIALIQGKVQVARGEIESGLESLERAVALAGSLDMRPTVWKAFAAASEALSAAGRDGEAHVKSEAARAVIQEIAGLFKDPDLRAAYLENALGKIRESSAIPG